MNCHEVMELMQRDLDQDLADAEHRAMLVHLRDCPDCAEMYEKLKMLSGQLESLPKVAPPISIVDSILPRLNELGLLSEQGASAELVGTASPAVEDPSPAADSRSQIEQARAARQNGKAGWFSWKIAGSVAAAALVIGMFIFNQQNNTLTKNADGLLIGTGAKQEAASQSAGAADTAKPSSLADTSKVMKNVQEAGKADGPENGAAVSPAATARTGFGVTPIPVPSASKDEKPVSAFEASGRIMPPAKASSSTEPNETATGADSAKAPAAVGAAAPEISTPDPSPNGAVSPEPTAAQKAKPNQEQPIVGIQTFEGSSADADKSTASQPNSGSTREFAAAKSLSDPHASSLASPDGTYTAVVKNQKVSIVDRQGNELFVSPIERKVDDTIALTGWNGAKLSYKVTTAGGKETAYTIDVKTKSETKN